MNRISRIIRLSQRSTKYHEGNKSKPLFPLIFDLIHWVILNRGHIIYFFLLGLYIKNRKVSDYLNFRSFKKSYKDFYPPGYLCLLEDKLIFEKFINNFPEYAPKNIGFVTKKHFYLLDGSPKPIEAILNYPMKCIVKNTWGFGGKDIFMLTIASDEIFINGIKSTVKDLSDKINERSLLQELVVQHDVLKKLHPASLNTSRIVTVNTGSDVHVISSLLRVGVDGNFVDNVAKGNLLVPIDIKTGKLAKRAYSDKDSLFYLSHPQTKTNFEGIDIPYYDEALKVCKKLHFQLPYFFVLGWDVAFTPTGPVVIESNNLHMVVLEQLWVGGLKNRFDGYIKEFMENKRTERRLNYA